MRRSGVGSALGVSREVGAGVPLSYHLVRVSRVGPRRAFESKNYLVSGFGAGVLRRRRYSLKDEVPEPVEVVPVLVSSNFEVDDSSSQRGDGSTCGDEF